MDYPCSNYWYGKFTCLDLDRININSKYQCFQCYPFQPISIIVNGCKINTIQSELSYSNVIGMVHIGTITADTCYSIIYKNANEVIDNGILNYGQSIKIKDGTIISAYITSNA